MFKDERYLLTLDLNPYFVLESKENNLQAKNSKI